MVHKSVARIAREADNMVWFSYCGLWRKAVLEMGRIAGPPSKLAISNAWKQEAKQRVSLKELKRPMAAFVVPSARKRQQALLWALVSYMPDGLTVGRKNHPPYTPDMRVLVERGLLRYGRRWGLGIGQNFVIATEAGIALAKSAVPTDEQVRYIGTAFGSSSIR